MYLYKYTFIHAEQLSFVEMLMLPWAVLMDNLFLPCSGFAISFQSEATGPSHFRCFLFTPTLNYGLLLKEINYWPKLFNQKSWKDSCFVLKPFFWYNKFSPCDLYFASKWALLSFNYSFHSWICLPPNHYSLSLIVSAIHCLGLCPRTMKTSKLDRSFMSILYIWKLIFTELVTILKLLKIITGKSTHDNK